MLLIPYEQEVHIVRNDAIKKYIRRFDVRNKNPWDIIDEIIKMVKNDGEYYVYRLEPQLLLGEPIPYKQISTTTDIPAYKYKMFCVNVKELVKRRYYTKRYMVFYWKSSDRLFKKTVYYGERDLGNPMLFTRNGNLYKYGSEITLVHLKQWGDDYGTETTDNKEV